MSQPPLSVFQVAAPEEALSDKIDRDDNQGIPQDMYEAATIDGADKGTQFFAITLPLLKGVIKTCQISIMLRMEIMKLALPKILV
mgnify:CR=1 FL=1